MIRLVLDTNVLVSALIKRGKPRELIFKIIEGKAQLFLSKSILEEFAKVAYDPKITRYVGEKDLIDFLKIIGSLAKLVKIRSKFKVISQDPSDDIVLRTAFDGKVDYIVSGDEHLLSLLEFRKIRIVSVSEMLDLMK